MLFELSIALGLRIYRLGDNPWNFNPHLLKNLTPVEHFFHKSRPYHAFIRDSMVIKKGTYVGGSPTDHFCISMFVGESDGQSVESRLLLTSGYKEGVPA